MFGDRLKHIIEKLNYSGNSFGDATGTDGSLISRTLRNKNLPSVKFCMDIHKVFPAINWDYMITGRGHPFFDQEEFSTGLEGVSTPSTPLYTPGVEEKKESYGNYKELYEQCQKLVSSNERLIEMQAKRIAELEGGNGDKKNRKAG